jgi:hypothetical protein
MQARVHPQVAPGTYRVTDRFRCQVVEDTEGEVQARGARREAGKRGVREVATEEEDDGACGPEEDAEKACKSGEKA